MPRRTETMMEGWQFALTVGAENEMPNPEAFADITLPHDWAVSRPFSQTMPQAEAQGYRDRYGIGWYKRNWRLEQKKEGHRYYLEFGGIFEDSIVWINGKTAGGRRYGYSTFSLDVTSLVHAGDNEVLVKVDNTKHPVDRWYSGAGIYRTVKWTEVEETHLNAWDVAVQTALNEDMSQAQVTVTTGIHMPVRAYLSFESTADGGVGIAENGQVLEETGTDQITFQVDQPFLWSAECPRRYRLTLRLLDGERVADEISFLIGIRTVTFDADHGMRVNGKPVKLKGVCLHQEVGCRGTAAKKEIWRKRLEDLKEMGCNAIRAAHHTHSEEFMDLCDEMGFYVYEECFDKWKGGLYGRYFDTEWKTDVEAMVKRDRNRPSVVIWGVGNEVENQAQDSMLSILKMLTDYVRTLDGTRPVTYAMNPHFKRESQVDLSKIEDIQKFVDEIDDTEIYDVDEKVERIARIAEYVDIISGNYLEALYPAIHARIPEKPILGTEIYQYFQGHAIQMRNFTDENPSLVPFYNDYVIGGMIWTGFDYLGESMGYPAKGWSGALIRTNRERRPSYYIMQSYWSEAPMVHLSVLDYSQADEGVKEMWDMPPYADHWQFSQFHKAVIPYMIASNCEEVALYLNGDRMYVPRPATCPNRVITGYLPWQPGTVTAVGYRDGREVCRHTLVTSGPAVKLEFEDPRDMAVRQCRAEILEDPGARKEARMDAPAEKGYEILLTVRAKDETGICCYRESGRVRFWVEGPAEIIGVDSGDITSSESLQESFIHMYHGCASVQIRLHGTPGRVAVHACGSGLFRADQVICVGKGEL